MIKNVSYVNVVLLLLFVSAIYLYPNIHKVWYIWDSGTYAQSGERVLSGELPHRDFDELFTGGLSYLNAGAFKLFGTKLSSIRIPFFICSLFFVWSLYSITSRATSAITAFAATLFIFIWSVPTFPSASPTWYTVFFASFGTICLIKYVESKHVTWLAVAGLCVGIAILFKITGLYFLAAALVFLLYYERILAVRKEGEFSVPFFLFVLLLVSTLCLCVVFLVRQQLGISQLMHHVMPVVILGVFLVYSEWKTGKGDFVFRAHRLTSLIIPFLLGMMVPIFLFVAIFFFNDALSELYQGIFVRPVSRFHIPYGIELPPLSSILYCLPLLPLFLVNINPKVDLLVAIVLALIATVILVKADEAAINRGIWDAIRYLPLLTILFGCIALFTNKELAASDSKGAVLFLVLALVALLPLVQFPFSHAIYFLYSLSFVFLGLIFLLTSQNFKNKFSCSVYVIFFIAFYVFWVRDAELSTLGLARERATPWQWMELDRGDLMAPASTARTYQHLVPFIQSKARGPHLYAGPDAPELYFLTGLRNPGGSLWDLFDTGRLESFDRRQRHTITNYANQELSLVTGKSRSGVASERSRAILTMIEDNKISVVVINNLPESSGHIDFFLAQELAIRFRQWKKFNNFLVGWNSY